MKDATLQEFNDRLHQICTDLRDQLGLIWRPIDGIDPHDLSIRGWYRKTDTGSWELVLPLDARISAITLGGLNIWLNGRVVEITETIEHNQKLLKDGLQ